MPRYSIRIGDVTIHNVHVEEIFDYVSPQDFEAFENARFKKEIVQGHMEGEPPVVTVKKSRGMPKKIALGIQDATSGDESATASSADDDRGAKNVDGEQTDRPGRPRPSYKNMYLKQRQRKQRSDAGIARKSQYEKDSASPTEEDRTMAEETQIASETGRKRASYKQLYLKQRQRKQRSDKGVARGPKHQQKSITANHIAIATSSLILDEPTKRRKLAHDSDDSSQIRSGLDNGSDPNSQQQQPAPPAVMIPKAPMAVLVPTLKPSLSDISSSSSSSPAPAFQPLNRDKGRGRAKEILPTAALTSDAQSSASSEASETFEIECILAHHMSDPRTHDPEFGDQPVMLYQVKWVGWAEPSWEPIESFDDLELVREYMAGAEE